MIHILHSTQKQYPKSEQRTMTLYVLSESAFNDVVNIFISVYSWNIIPSNKTWQALGSSLSSNSNYNGECGQWLVLDGRIPTKHPDILECTSTTPLASEVFPPWMKKDDVNALYSFLRCWFPIAVEATRLPMECSGVSKLVRISTTQRRLDEWLLPIELHPFYCYGRAPVCSKCCSFLFSHIVPYWFTHAAQGVGKLFEKHHGSMVRCCDTASCNNLPRTGERFDTDPVLYSTDTLTRWPRTIVYLNVSRFI